MFSFLKTDFIGCDSGPRLKMEALWWIKLETNTCKRFHFRHHDAPWWKTLHSTATNNYIVGTTVSVANHRPLRVLILIWTWIAGSTMIYKRLLILYNPVSALCFVLVPCTNWLSQAHFAPIGPVMEQGQWANRSSPNAQNREKSLKRPDPAVTSHHCTETPRSESLEDHQELFFFFLNNQHSYAY